MSQINYILCAECKQCHLSGDGPFLYLFSKKVDIPSLRKVITSSYPCMKDESIEELESDLSLLKEKMRKWTEIDLNKTLPPQWLQALS